MTRWSLYVAASAQYFIYLLFFLPPCCSVHPEGKFLLVTRKSFFPNYIPTFFLRVPFRRPQNNKNYVLNRKNNEKQIKSIKYKNECAWNERNCAPLCTRESLFLGRRIKKNKSAHRPAFSTFVKL